MGGKNMLKNFDSSKRVFNWKLLTLVLIFCLIMQPINFASAQDETIENNLSTAAVNLLEGE
jgi:hypothetical protein